MPARQDISRILVIGSGPIVIGQACEFDYSGTQACRVLKEEGYVVVLVNPNPATIMTDPDFADATYLEPLETDILAAIIVKERPDAILPTLGGQTALNAAMGLAQAGILERFGVEMIGANALAIQTAENRELFKAAMVEIGLAVVDSGFASNLEKALEIADEVGYPVIVRPSFILGGAGTGVAHNKSEMVTVAKNGISASPIGEILIESSIVGWKEYELEVMRDVKDNCVVICSIENVDPMGVHTGDSITVAPAQTLSDVEYQQMRNAAFQCIRRIGVETGGSNIQFAINPSNGEMVVIEMNPRVSRSSALASKATGFPIAKIAAKLAVGYSLDEITNDITRSTPASFEPTIDYVVTKVPRWAFEKFPGISDTLGTKMQSVGEAMAIGRTFPESLQKALRSLEQGRLGLNCDPGELELEDLSDEQLLERASVPTPERIFHVESALRRKIPIERVFEATSVDPWFLDQLTHIVEVRDELECVSIDTVNYDLLYRAKRAGFSDAQIAWLWSQPLSVKSTISGKSNSIQEIDIRRRRTDLGIFPTFKTVDTCGAEFDASTPYYYSTYEDEDEVQLSAKPSVIILGSGPNRIGQGIEFDYCCVHASWALGEMGIDSVMINCNPETVSTDYDTSTRLYFEPISEEDVLNVISVESRSIESPPGTGNLAGVIVSLGGQTPLKLCHSIPEQLILGTKPSSIDLAEDRKRWSELCDSLGILQPPGGTAINCEEAVRIAELVEYPVLVRPSYVLGGRAMEIVYNQYDLERAFRDLEFSSSEGSLSKEGGLARQRPVLIDRFLEDAIEVDVDAVRDSYGNIMIGGVLEHVEEAGVHSGDSACVLPPPTLSQELVDQLEDNTCRIAQALDVCGLVNVQYAVRDGLIYVLEANPRASRTVPFVSKATGVPLAKVATWAMMGLSFEQMAERGFITTQTATRYEISQLQGGESVAINLYRAYRMDSKSIAVKEAVLPFDRFPDADSLLGPEMRSTGEVMGISDSFGLSFAKSQIAAGNRLPSEGAIFLSLADRDKKLGGEVAGEFVELGFRIFATKGTAIYLASIGVPVEKTIAKLTDPNGGQLESEPNFGDPIQLISNAAVSLIINTPRGRGARADGAYIRKAASAYGVPCITTIAAARAAISGIRAWSESSIAVRSLQELIASGKDVAGDPSDR